MERTWDIIQNVLTYPLIKMGEGSLTLQSLLILGVLFAVVLVNDNLQQFRNKWLTM